jgi:hypothetical protein
MSWWQYLFALVLIIAAGLNAGVQFFEPDSLGDSHYAHVTAQFIASNKLWVSIIFSILVGLGTFTGILLQPRKVRKDFRVSLIDGIFEQLLDNDRNQARVTLFKDVGFLRTWWYRAKDFIGLRRKKISIRECWNYCWSAHYIRILSRWGTQHPNSTTYFCVNKQTASQCQGVAGQVRQREEMIVVDLPRLDDRDPKTLDLDDPDVKEYMKRGYISDISVLRSIKRLAPYIYGNIITANGGRRKYVLVIDSWAEKSPFKSPNVKRALAAYVKQISASFGERS